MGLGSFKKDLYALIKKEAFIKKKITLSSGKTSSYYLDLRRVTLSSRGVYLVSNIFLQMLKKEKFSALGGPTLGADPIVAGLAYIYFLKNKPIKTFLIRKSPKKHGTQRLIEGPLLKKGQRVVVFDDVATTGKSLVESIKVLNAEKVKVVKAFCIVDRQEGAGQALAKYGVRLESIFLGKDFLK